MGQVFSKLFTCINSFNLHTREVYYYANFIDEKSQVQRR